jgi:hypothetical protein
VTAVAPTRTSSPTRTPSVSIFGGPPLAPIGPGASPAARSSGDVEEAPPPTTEGPSSGVLWGAGALALIGAATALAVDAARKRKEEEERLRAEMEARNAALRAKEEAALAAAIAAANAAAAAKAAQQAQAALLADSDAHEWQEQEIENRRAGQNQAREAREAGSAMEEDVPEPVGDLPHSLVDLPQNQVSQLLDSVAFEIPLQGDYRIPLIPTSLLTSTEYLISYRLRLRSPAQAPSVIANPDGFQLIQREPANIPGSWTYNLRDGSATASRAAPWTIPIHGYDNSFAQLRWSTSWRLDSYDGEPGLRISIGLDSRVVIGGYEISNSTASLVAIERFRPMNGLILFGSETAVVLAYLIVGPAWAAFTAAGGSAVTCPGCGLP